MNQSFAQTQVPTMLKTYIIYPMVKIGKHRVSADFRPISIASVLSRLLGCIIVQTYNYTTFSQPAMDRLLTDQFAFWPTGSTSAALISILQQATNIMDTNDYVDSNHHSYQWTLVSLRHGPTSGFCIQAIAFGHS